MAITLFQKRDFRGDQAVITRDENDLKDIPLGRNPTSLRMTSTNDAVLLFKKRDWRGGVLYRRRVQSIAHLGSPREGGRNTFGNSIASVRLRPFHIHLNVTVVTQSDGTLPGAATDLRNLEGTIRDTVDLLNTFYERQQALLVAHVAHVNQRVHNNKFNLSIFEAARFPASWKNAREIDFILVNSFDRRDVLGLAKPPWAGKVVIVAMRRREADGPLLETDGMAETLAHEIGHFLGSNHDGRRNNIMQATGLVGIGTATAGADQIEEWHTKLSRNLTRRRNRHEA